MPSTMRQNMQVVEVSPWPLAGAPVRRVLRGSDHDVRFTSRAAVPDGSHAGMIIGFPGLAELFDRPVYGSHNPMVLSWSDDQLAPVVEALRSRLPGGTTGRMALAVAACALAVVIETQVSGQPLRYSRAKEAYRTPKRYRSRGRHHTWHCVTKSMDILNAAGLIGHDLGVWSTSGRGHQSVAWPTDELTRLLEPVIEERGVQPAVPIASETVVLRDRADKKEVDYSDTAETETMRTQVELINRELSKLHLVHRGQRFDIPPARRIFNGDFTRGGRLYCHGPSFQNIRAHQRRDLQQIIDGAAHTMVEIDYANLHITMAYAEAGERMRPGDQYTIEGFARGLVKIALNTMLNAPNRTIGISAITEELHTNQALRTASNLATHNRRACRTLANRVVRAIEAKHWRIRAYFGSDCGARFQRQDSDMAVQVMIRVLQKTGRCPLPVHDSFIVPDIDGDILAETMREVAVENQLPLFLKDSRGTTWTPAPHRGSRGTNRRPLYMEVKNTHRGKQGVHSRKSALGNDTHQGADNPPGLRPLSRPQVGARSPPIEALLGRRPAWTSPWARSGPDRTSSVRSSLTVRRPLVVITRLRRRPWDTSGTGPITTRGT